MIKVLVVDDEVSICEFFEIFLRKEGYLVTTTTSSNDALEMLRATHFDLVISDLKMPGVGGLEVLQRAKEVDPNTIVILITAFGSMENAIEAMKRGAYDYILKPFQVDNIKHVVTKASERLLLARENVYLRTTLEKRMTEDVIVGESQKLQKLLVLIERIKDKDITVLITGESGTGKELIARTLHYTSRFHERPFVALNCAAIPETLIESELFGHVKGAFTGATAHKKGLFEYTGGGTIFLDEIGDLPPMTQVKLLRVLQERTVRRLGSNEDTKIEARVITATNRDLDQAVAQGSFREDLYYRLNVFHLHMPPLRERREDIPQLAAHFLQRLAPAINPTVQQLSPEALELLANHDYPGNIRELRNIIERGLAIETSTVLTAEALGTLGRKGGQGGRPCPGSELPEQGLDLEEVLSTLERDYLIKALTRTNGVIGEAAKLLNTTFRSFRYRLQKHGLVDYPRSLGRGHPEEREE
ncbi:MAG: hypothetical protein A2284_06295 [Deltaproteobacteria bacterium RIFOXYA12_FULL_61_11]|nr:MAG: hypothetical protein A2284_06295 [Deltaproteobacteria bacterium RIFOXYA12_FULL_61_11]